LEVLQMINDMHKKILVKAIEIGMENGEDALEILKSYPNLSIAEKQEIGKEVGIDRPYLHGRRSHVLYCLREL